MTKFDPKEHLIDLRGKKYLPVNMRLVWFREDHPNGSIQTEVINFEPIVAQARVYNSDGVLLATGHGTANNGQKAVWSGREIEKAETAAIGRALGHAGYGTQFDNDDDDLDNLADSPIEFAERTPQQALHGNGQTERRIPPRNGASGVNGSKTDLKATSSVSGVQTQNPTGDAQPDEPARVAESQDANFSTTWSVFRNDLLVALTTPGKKYAYQERANTVEKMHEEGAFTGVSVNAAIPLVLERLANHQKVS